MTPVAKKTVMTLAVVGAFGLGAWARPYLQPNEAPVVVSSAPAASGDLRLPGEPVRTRPAATTATAAEAHRSPVLMRGSSLEPMAEPVRDQAKPLLTWGTNTRKAAEGFTSAEQFLTVAHAARNTEVPFALLKHRVLNEKQSLADAIKASRSDVDATLEADRAELNARADLQRLASGLE